MCQLSGKNNDGLVDNESMYWEPFDYDNETNIIKKVTRRATRSKKRGRNHSHEDVTPSHCSQKSQFFSTRLHPLLLMSLQQDITHYAYVLDSEQKCVQIYGSINIMTNCNENERFHFNKDDGYLAIYPFFPYTKHQYIYALKVSFKS